MQSLSFNRFRSTLLRLLCMSVMAAFLAGCNVAKVEEGWEGAVIDKPYFLGHEGIRPQPISTGRHVFWWTTGVAQYEMRPQILSEPFKDLTTQDRTPVTFNSYITVRIRQGQTPLLHSKFGPKWYENNIKEPYRTMVRDFARGKNLFELTNDVTVIADGQEAISQQLTTLIAKLGIPVDVQQCVIGAVRPPDEVIAETSRTAAQEQRKQTEDKRASAEINRKVAETNKADADLAYATNFGMNADQYLRYRQLEIQKEIVEVVKGKDNVHVIVNAGGATPEPMFGVGK
ncbi:hypothetical protein E4T66_17500 [Sinimarinibacterium sp. CAU 1509]|uniref:SPFH domain-containing protein n=1 Tax=Sinimarinibacterium sp. CAU 1509 TaxID=2562283 RepID=UPI0010AD9838|nr:SPFH domain-containing protein [Sinimarinibacterium sp. CAU 1509]TJY57205.1 hypothetical protein E4T66_17500 [Sinimarinibacterium sp. CAU 1509]